MERTSNNLKISFKKPTKVTGLKVTEHATNRIHERFKVSKHKAKAWAVEKLRKAEYISNILDDNLREGRLFTAEGISFVLDLHEDTLVTVYIPVKNERMAEKVRKIFMKDLEKATKNEERTLKRNTTAIEELKIEYHQTKLKSLRARKPSLINEYSQRLDAINREIHKLEDEINKSRLEKSYIAKGLVAYL